ncbi:hypothetical protein BGZ47_007667 [Haplosporangium gracile]|nr:hypothetical protein BGZ47_007667 [Haplosporangium gracile]
MRVMQTTRAVPFRNTHKDQDRDRDKEDRVDQSATDSDKAHQCLVGWISIPVASQVHHQWDITVEVKDEEDMQGR